jgi:hypothetical protein
MNDEIIVVTESFKHGLSRPYDTDRPKERNPWDPQTHPKHYSYIKSIIDRVDSEPHRPVKYSEETKLEVYRLRDSGLTLRQIADETGVSKSTACLYLQKLKRQREAETRELILQSQSATVIRPGTTTAVETSYTVTQVDIGKIPTKKPTSSNA